MIALDFSKPVIGKASIDIARPVEMVFNEVGVHFFDNYPKWALEVDEFEPLDGNTVDIGKRARQIRTDQGQRAESIFKITVFNPPQELTLQGIDAPYRDSYVFEKISEDKTRLTFSFELLELELFMRPFQKLIRVAIEEGAENTVANIKELLLQ